MSQENVEVVRRGLDAFNRRDENAILSIVHSEVEWDSGLPGTSVWQGHEGVRKMLQAVEAAWEESKLVAIGFTDLGDVVVADCRLVARGRTSGASVEGPQVGVAELSGGLITRMRIFADRAQALEAAGLSE